MTSFDSDDARATKLSAFFNKVLHDQRKLFTTRDEKLFIEAICVQADPSICVHKLLSSSFELSVLQASMRFDTSITFCNEEAVSLLRYLQMSSLKAIANDFVLAQLLLSMMKSSFF
jgi:hypothetical protein